MAEINQNTSQDNRERIQEYREKTKKCNKCKKTKLREEHFYISSTGKDGFKTICKECSAKKSKKKKKPTPDFQKCKACKNEKRKEEFQPSTRSFNGLAALCDVCASFKTQKFPRSLSENKIQKTALSKADPYNMYEDFWSKRKRRAKTTTQTVENTNKKEKPTNSLAEFLENLEKVIEQGLIKEGMKNEE